MNRSLVKAAGVVMEHSEKTGGPWIVRISLVQLGQDPKASLGRFARKVAHRRGELFGCLDIHAAQSQCGFQEGSSIFDMEGEAVSAGLPRLRRVRGRDQWRQLSDGQRVIGGWARPQRCAESRVLRARSYMLGFLRRSYGP